MAKHASQTPWEELVSTPWRDGIRSGFVVAGLGILTTLPFHVWEYVLQSQNRSAAAIAMSDMHMDRMSVYWSFPILQATGLAALIWTYLGVMLGLVLSARTPRWIPFSRSQVDQIHRQISLLVIGLILVHALATARDAMGDTLRSAFIPWQASWAAGVTAYNIGIFAFYLALLLGPTYYLRNRLGVRRWRFAHRFVLVVYVLSVWHTLILGADVKYYGWVRPFLWMMQLPVLALFCWRLLRPAQSESDAWTTFVRYALVGAGAVTAVGIIALVATGAYASVVRSIQ